MTIKNETTMCATSAQPATIDAASRLRTFVRDLNPIAPSTDVRAVGDFVGTSWSPPV